MAESRSFQKWVTMLASGLVTASGPALVVHRGQAPDFLGTMPGVQQAATALNTLVARREK